MKYTFNSFYLDSPLITGRVFDIFEPETVTRDTAIFIVHGGGWRGGCRTKFHKIMEEFNNRGFITASTDYRLYAKDAFEQLSDIRASYDRFVTYLKEHNRPLKIAVYGESAGAHLASLLLCAAPGECGENNDLVNEWVKPAYGLLQATPYSFLPWDDMMPQTWSMLQDIAGKPYAEDPERYERLSLKNYVRADNPPLFFLEAELEGMFMSELTLDIVRKHREMGINSQWKIYKRMEHGFFYELKRSGQLAAIDDICTCLTTGLETNPPL